MAPDSRIVPNFLFGRKKGEEEKARKCFTESEYPKNSRLPSLSPFSSRSYPSHSSAAPPINRWLNLLPRRSGIVLQPEAMSYAVTGVAYAGRPCRWVGKVIAIPRIRAVIDAILTALIAPEKLRPDRVSQLDAIPSQVVAGNRPAE